MAKKREIFKVNEDALKDMMARESISCAKPETGSIENLPSREAENEVKEVEKREQKYAGWKKAVASVITNK